MDSIGSMMKGSGLEEALERAYGPNAVTQMMSGKAISRALCRHFLIEAALVNKLIDAGDMTDAMEMPSYLKGIQEKSISWKSV